MSTLTIHNIEETLKNELQMMAAKHGISMEEQASVILRDALMSKKKKGLGNLIHQRFATANSVELELPTRSSPRQAPHF